MCCVLLLTIVHITGTECPHIYPKTQAGRMREMMRIREQGRASKVDKNEKAEKDGGVIE